MSNGNTLFPGIDLLPERLQFRSFSGDSDSGEWLGGGFIRHPQHFTRLKSPRYVLVWILRGNGYYIDAAGREYPFFEGSFFQRFPDCEHTSIPTSDSGHAEFYLSMGAELYNALVAMKLTPSPAEPVSSAKVIPARLERMWGYLNLLRLEGGYDLTAAFSELVALLNDFRNARFLEGSTRDWGKVIAAACGKLTENWSCPPDMKMFCRHHAVGYENFRKIFQRQTGASPGRYRIIRRLELADCLLEENKLNIGEIAEKLGFSSVFDFSAQFKKYRGISPGRTRKGTR